jgi:hypothetical protein
MLTLIVNTKVKTALVIVIHNSAEASAGSSFRIHFANLSPIPASSFRVAKFLDNVLGAKVVQANLSHTTH